MSLRERLIERIRAEGPISIAAYMTACLHDPEGGYYARRPAIGEAGDFITAPLVSQMFGELIGLWAVEVWRRLGEPARVTLAELGPGTGVMMADILRAARLAPAFLAAADIWFVETSAPLRALQTAAVTGARSVESIEALPSKVPVILLANEFLDCLPVDQWERTDGGWAERRVGVERGELAFTTVPHPSLPFWGGWLRAQREDGWGSPKPRESLGLSAAAPANFEHSGACAVPHPDAFGVCPSPEEPAPDVIRGEGGMVLEHSQTLVDVGRSIGALVARAGGAALCIDYGRDAPGFGDTLQAVRAHAKEHPLAHPGEADLTAHVDFPTFLQAARAAGAQAAPLETQAAFLARMGLRERAEALRRAHPDRAETIARQSARLTAPGEMGGLFIVACPHAPGFAPP